MNVSTIAKSLAVAAMVGTSWLAIGSDQKVQAATFVESGDAGQTLATAQVLGPLTINGGDSITGRISTRNDADLFSFDLVSTTDLSFFATTFAGATFDTILSLFDSAGILLAQNDDSFGTLQSTLALTNVSAGTYLLGISSFANFPTDGPTFPNGGAINERGNYRISLLASDSTPQGVPTPALLPGLIGIGVAALRKRKGEAASEA